MRFWNYKSDEFYNLYSQIFDSNFSIEKKKVVLKALFSGEYSLMRITSISKQCYEEYKKNIQKINEKLEECPVCFTSSETTIRIKKCNHVFCEDCIQKWLKDHKNTCPICRVNVTIEEQENSNNSNNSNN